MKEHIINYMAVAVFLVMGIICFVTVGISFENKLSDWLLLLVDTMNFIAAYIVSKVVPIIIEIFKERV